jgi:DNA processing protein
MALGSELYPPLLAEIHDPPPLLYLRGLTDTLLMPQLAIVGSRRHGVASARAARQIAGDLTAAGFSICSGMALGIDAVAHEAALEANGRTVAVMGTGIDRCYPGRHAGLAERITSQGLLVTEFPPGYGPRRENFPRRNRLISGLCAGVLVVEAARRSGSLITARLAMEQNREVFALPHSIYDPGGAGCNALIKDGAGLVEHAADIAGELGGLLAAQILAQSGEPAGTQAAQNLSARLAALHAAVGYEAVTVDELVLAGHGLASEVVAGLTELQVRGLVVNRGGLYVRNCG